MPNHCDRPIKRSPHIEFFIVYRAKHATAVTRTYQEAPFRLARPFLPDPGELVTIAVTIVGAPPD
jgi:urease accessory protein UreH